MEGETSMTAANALAEIHSCPLFKDISTEQLSTLNTLLKMKTVDEGATIFIENMRGESLYLIRKGAIKISKMLSEGDEQVLTILGPEDVFGEMAVFDGGSRSASARVAEQAEIYSLSRTDYDYLSELDPSLCLQLTKNIISIFSEKVRASQQDYREMLLTTLERNS